MGHGFGVNCYALGRKAHDERQRHEAGDGHGEDGEGVLVGQHGGLADHLLVGHADGQLVGLDGVHAVGLGGGGVAGDIAVVAGVQ